MLLDFWKTLSVIPEGDGNRAVLLPTLVERSYCTLRSKEKLAEGYITLWISALGFQIIVDFCSLPVLVDTPREQHAFSELQRERLVLWTWWFGIPHGMVHLGACLPKVLWGPAVITIMEIILEWSRCWEVTFEAGWSWDAWLIATVN